MNKINILSFDIANLIAAGEVVERPSSAIKELVENSIDSNAKKIVIEIRGNGTKYMRVSDDGSGISPDDLPLSILRHATSKISNSEDLQNINTLGFRGEALASISAVSKLKISSKTCDEEYGQTMVCIGGQVSELKESGMPCGTSVTVEDLFYNVPVRRKFLKRDAFENAVISNVVKELAVSCPSISFKYIFDRNVIFNTKGDDNLLDSIYEVYGIDYKDKLIKIEKEENGINIFGYVSNSLLFKSSRSSEHFFLNSRLINSKTLSAAVEQAYRTHLPIGKFPVTFLNISINPSNVDVNIHPSKLEVKFINEQEIFNIVYYAVIGALEKPSFERPYLFEDYKSHQVVECEKVIQKKIASLGEVNDNTIDIDSIKTRDNIVEANNEGNNIKNEHNNLKSSDVVNKSIDNKNDISQDFSDEYVIIGELYNTYIIVQLANKILIIDKHAAHERIIFDKLKKVYLNKSHSSQMLLFPIEIQMDEMCINTIINNYDFVNAIGFDYRKSDNASILVVTGIPNELSRDESEALIEDLAFSLDNTNGSVKTISDDYFMGKLYQASCKAAIKGGRVYNHQTQKYICDHIIGKYNEDESYINVCPHGRPVAFEIKKSFLDRKFEREK